MENIGDRYFAIAVLMRRRRISARNASSADPAAAACCFFCGGKDQGDRVHGRRYLAGFVPSADRRGHKERRQPVIAVNSRIIWFSVRRRDERPVPYRVRQAARGTTEPYLCRAYAGPLVPGKGIFFNSTLPPQREMKDEFEPSVKNEFIANDGDQAAAQKKAAEVSCRCIGRPMKWQSGVHEVGAADQD